MPQCGNCKNNHATVQEVKACYAKGKVQVKVPRGGNILSVGVKEREAAVAAIEFPDSTKPNYGRRPELIPFAKVPEARYALRNVAGASNVLTFFEVREGKKKWDGFTFVDRLVGGGLGDFVRYPVKGRSKAIILRAIADDPAVAAKQFADEFSVCARCGRTLTDDDSRARGLGPDCAAYFGG